MASAMTAVAGATGIRSWLATRRYSWLTRRRMRAVTITLLGCALLAAALLASGSSAPAQPHAPSAHAAAR
jgi:hypothetical protein